MNDKKNLTLEEEREQLDREWNLCMKAWMMSYAIAAISIIFILCWIWIA